MSKKTLATILTTLFVATVLGCGAEDRTEPYTLSYEEMDTEQKGTLADEKNAIQDEQNTAENNTSTMETEVTEADALTFTDLSKRRFEFSSGAGGWSEEFTIERDGYFTGHYHDSDMGSTGEGYADGTVYSSFYSGHFTDLTRINEYTYQMKLADITYRKTPDTEEIIDNTRYIYTRAYCLGATDTFTVYLPGTPLEEIGAEVRTWIDSYNQSETQLTMIIIVDETNGYGIYSLDRLSPLEDAQMTLNSYKESYEYYESKLSEAGTTLEMVECTGVMYRFSDECLNYIWNLIRYNVEEEKFDTILSEQRAWITEKETKAQEAADQHKGGSMAAVDYNEMLAELTMKRCEELVEYLK